jgi:hypothetical protein
VNPSGNFASPSDRIKQLCEEAMRNPDLTVKEKTMMGSLPPRVAALPASPTPAPRDAATTTVPAVVARPEPVREPSPVEPDKELISMLEQRERRMRLKHGQTRLLANVALLVLIVAPVTAVCVSPTLRGKFDRFVGHLTNDVEDVRIMADTRESSGDALDQVAMRGAQIDAANHELGVDPTTVPPDEDPEMVAELKQLMGEDADGFAARRAKLESMGKVAGSVSGNEDPAGGAE